MPEEHSEHGTPHAPAPAGEQNPLITELARLHATIRQDSPELASAIAWLVARGAPQPAIMQETVSYPGGAYVNVQVQFGTGDNVHISGAYLLVHNPSVALVELRRAGLAAGDPNRWEPYIPDGFLAPDAPPSLPPVGAAMPGRPGFYFTVAGDQTPIGTKSSDPRGEFEKVEVTQLLWNIPAWRKLA